MRTYDRSRRAAVRVLRLLAVGLAITASLWLLLGSVDKPLLFNRGGGSQAVYANRGELLRLTLSSDDKYRLWVPLEDISIHAQRATLLYEDQYYYYHPGVNPISLLRSAGSTYLWGSRRRGGSTISMQVARMRFAIDSRTLPGKIEQIARALQLEWHFTKDEILEAYFNLAPYGGNIEGIGAASLVYFGKQPGALAPLDALSLAVIPQNPRKRDPAAITASSGFYEARQRLYQQWEVAFGAVPELRDALTLPLAVRERRQLPFIAPHFVTAVLAESHGIPSVPTTLNVRLQRTVEQVTSAFVDVQAHRGISNAAVLLLDWKSMEVRAHLGAVDFQNVRIQGQVDGTRAKRSPGSALKPFIYALAVDQGLIHSRSILKDAPLSFAAYDPENFDQQFVGPIRAVDALVRSRNVPAVHLANQLGSGGFYRFLQQAEIGQLRAEEFYGLATVLGGVEVSVYELVRLYATLANAGTLKSIRKTSVTLAGPTRQLLSPEASFIALDMLSYNPRPDEAKSDRLVAWKTGTSFGFRDAWAVGVFGDYVLGVWIGNFDNRANPAFVGREAAGPLFFSLVDAVRLQERIQLRPPYPMQAALKKVEVCSVSGQLPGPWCPHRKSTWFIPGKSPIHSCSVHRTVTLDASTGLRACESFTGETKEQVFEFWTSDLLEVFDRAGIPRRVPPAYLPSCEGSGLHGVAPEILSPQRGVAYQVRMGDDVAQPIALRAAGDADVRALFWFVDGKFLGRASPKQSLFWNPHPGRYVVRVLDDYGRADARELRVELAQ